MIPRNIWPAFKFLVLRLKIHWSPAQRKAVSGVVETTVSSTAGGEPVVCRISKFVTAPAVPIVTPFASQTRNFVGTVLPCLKALEPSALIGWRIAWPTSPLQFVVEYRIV